MGSPDFAVPALNALWESGRYAPCLVASQPDRPRGRGRRTTPTAVRERANALGIECIEMSRETYVDGVARIRRERPDVVIVVAFGVIIRSDLLEMPPHGCLNVHASLLPRHRGVSPIQASLLVGDTITGCTTMMIDEGIDTGDILLTEETRITPDDTAGTLSDRLADIGAGLLIRTLDGLFDGTVTRTPQPASPVPYTRKIRKTHGRLDWSRSADDVWRRVRAMTPWPSAYTFVNGRRVIVTRSAVAAGSGPPGTTLSVHPLRVACGVGALEIHELKPEGGRVMPASAWLAGHSLQVGDLIDAPDSTG